MTQHNYSYWEQESFLSQDIVIIGGGIVGLSAAIALKRAHAAIKVTVLEAGFLPSGASTKNAGFACFGSLSELIEQEKISDEQTLLALIAERWTGLALLREWLGDANMAYENLGGFELFTHADRDRYAQCMAEMPRYNHLLKEIVGGEVFQNSAQKIPQFGFKGIAHLIENRYEGQLHTGKMMRSLLQLAQQEGVNVLNNCSVSHIEQVKGQVMLHTNQGLFKCKQVGLATNAFALQLYPELDLYPGRGQVLITAPIPKLKLKGSFHYDRGYYYFRNIDNRILLGGGRHLDFKAEQTTAFGANEEIMQALEQLLAEVILPEQPVKIAQRWSGIMAFGKALKPLIKELEPGVYAALRCNGMGLAMGSKTGSQLAALMLRDL